MWNLPTLVGTSALFRCLLIFYGRIQDQLMDVKFTDIDYHVFSDGAKHLAEGDSPFDRDTYRYSPILAYILLPVVDYPEFGKFLFNACDLAAAIFIYCIVKKILDPNSSEEENSETEDSTCSETEEWARFCAAVWLYNPITCIISSRGNAEGLISLTVLSTLYCLIQGQWIIAAVIHGILAVTLKIYPIIYLPSIFVFIAADFGHRPLSVVSLGFKQWLIIMLCNWRGYCYALITLGGFALTTYLSYLRFGDLFLQEAIFYHVSRTDLRHNFSPYFYLLYIGQDEWWFGYLGLLAFVPQLLIIVTMALRFGHSDLSFTWFISTFAFVSFNKVCTSQYFVWYLTMFPLILPKLSARINLASVTKLTLAWFGGQGIWLFFAYLFEFRGYNTFIAIWISSLLFLGINIRIMAKLIKEQAALEKDSTTAVPTPQKIEDKKSQ